MNFIEILLVEKLESTEPALDVMGSDNQILQAAYQDFMNYLRFHWNFIGKEASQERFIEKLEKQLYENPAELEAFLTIWTFRWFKKWRERVKLLIGDQRQNEWKVSKISSSGKLRWKKFKHKQELIEAVVSVLLRNGEICGTEILAETLLKEAFENKRSQKFSDKEHMLNFVYNVLRKAREISQIKEPLLFVKINKNHYRPK